MTTVPTPVPHRRAPRLVHALVVGVLVVLAAAAALVLAHEWGAGWSPRHVVRGSGIAAVESRNVPTFAAIDLAGATEVTVTVGNERAVVVAADDNLIDLLTTEVRGRTLVVETNGAFTTEVTMTVDVTVPTLDAVTLSGSGVVTVEDVKAEQLTIRMPGHGVLAVRGTAQRLDVELSGSGNALLGDLVAGDAAARLSGFGRLEVHATGSLDATVSGTGVIVYSGDPGTVTRHVTGVGAIRGS